MKKKIMIQCAATVNRDAIRRETIDGVEHIVVTSMTLPGNIVMNGGLYPADEIDSSFHTLERTLAPVEHPQDGNGNFVSANDPQAIHNFHAGAFNANVVKDGNRIKIDKFINVQEAKKTERGKRLLDRINEIETNDNPRPIHTSTGVFLEVEVLGEVKTNAEGLEYDWIARNMVFDHDAILLDSVAAAQPHQGVGMAVNNDSKYEVQTFVMNESEAKPNSENRKETVVHTNAHGLSGEELIKKLIDALEGIGIGVCYIEDIFDEDVIFHAQDELFTVPYRVDNGLVTIVGIPVPVERVVSFIPKTNQKGEAMKEIILNALKEKGIDINGLEDLDDAALLAKYNESLQANQESGGSGSGESDTAALADVVANALKPVTEKLESLEGMINAQSEADVAKCVEAIMNSGQYPGLDADSAKLLGLEKLKEMAANCGVSVGISPMVANEDNKFKVSSRMPGDTE